MKSLTAEELDDLFDAGEDVSEYFDWENATRPGLYITVHPVSAESAPAPEK
jgi:hypothetical protein